MHAPVPPVQVNSHSRQSFAKGMRCVKHYVPRTVLWMRIGHVTVFKTDPDPNPVFVPQDNRGLLASQVERHQFPPVFAVELQNRSIIAPVNKRILGSGSLWFLEGGQFCPQPAFSRPKRAAAAKIGRPPKTKLRFVAPRRRAHGVNRNP